MKIPSVWLHTYTKRGEIWLINAPDALYSANAITSFARQSNRNVVLSSRFARHSDLSTTMTYINTRKDELYKAVDEAFLVENAEKLKNWIKSLK